MVGTDERMKRGERGAVINISWLPSQMVLHNGSYCLSDRNQTAEREREGTLKRLFHSDLLLSFPLIFPLLKGHCVVSEKIFKL